MPTPTCLSALLFCCMHFCSQYLLVVSALCLEDQRSLLLNFKGELEQVSISGKMSTWNESIACCQWSGVTCDHDGHVIGLDLSGEHIHAKIHNSSSLFDLSYLHSLNLADNSLLWPHASEFNKLSTLTYLNLSHATYSEGSIPKSISQLTRLVTLDLSVHPPFADGFPKIQNLQKFLQNLTKIKQLHLDGVNVSAQGPEWTAALLQIPTLQELSMSGSNLFGPLQSSLAILENLSVIILDGNRFSSVVPESYANFKNLTILRLSNCKLIGVFPHKIFLIPTLSFIEISFNGDLHGSFPDFPVNASLHTLSILFTNFSGPLPNSVGYLRHLSILYLAGSQFSGALPSSLSNLTQLVHVNLSNNRFSGPIPCLAKCKRLQLVSLSGNNFSGAIPSTHFEGLMNLKEIHLQNNFLTGKIPTSIFMLPSLTLVDFSNNKFEGDLNVPVKATCGIKYLYLRRNCLEGPIPVSLFEIEQLKTLDLSFNRFNGAIDLSRISKPATMLFRLKLSGNNISNMDATKMPSFSLFPNLTSLYLDSCKFTAFPQFLKNQSELSVLDLSNNHITGTIPLWISKPKLRTLNISNNYLTNWEESLLTNMSNLQILDLQANYLRLLLPIWAPKLYYLDYSMNNLSLDIPSDFLNYLPRTAFLSLSGNYLHGNIPASICNASHLKFLDLSYNALTGKIPQCLIAMSNGSLEVLNLERNKLNGTIDTFQGSCRLRSLHLNGNSLQGKLPRFLVNCSMLEILDLEANQIEDEFPCWLQNISMLRVLILRSNKFHGSLKCQASHVGWPLLQIVDLSSNSFGGRIPPSFFESLKAMMVHENDERGRNLSHLGRAHKLRYATFNGDYYCDKVHLTIKEHKLELVKILDIFTAIDLSHNKFEGQLPQELGQMNALHILNLSHNAFSGHIPSSMGNLKDLESLDLSSNNLSGEIPTELAGLSFLAFLNLSYNHLVGKIPTGTQIQSFDAALFRGNDKLCGPPLTPNCGSHVPAPPPASNSNKKSSIDWNFIAAEVGFASAIGIMVLLLVFHNAWRIWYWGMVENILYHMFPQLDFVIERRNGQNYRVLRWMT